MAMASWMPPLSFRLRNARWLTLDENRQKAQLRIEPRDSRRCFLRHPFFLLFGWDDECIEGAYIDLEIFFDGRYIYCFRYLHFPSFNIPEQ
jgi:hypothetical protein